MIAKLAFDLDQPDDRQQHLRCVKATSTLLALSGFAESLRNYIKNNEREGDPDGMLCALFWQERLHDELEQHSVDLDELLS
jgi:hypothetical protein